MLTTLVERTPGARGAIFCDHEGESVELVLRDPQLSEFDLKIFGAQLASVWMDLSTTSSEHAMGSLVELRVVCAKGTVLCRSLPDGYYVALLVGSGSPSAFAGFALREAAAEIASEI